MTPTWEQVKEAWQRAEQAGYDAVLQAAKVGEMLIELKEATPHGEFVQRAEHFVGLKRISCFNLMKLARNLPLLEQHRPDSQRAALALISDANPKPKKEVAVQPKDTYSYRRVLEELGVATQTAGGGQMKPIKEQLQAIDPNPDLFEKPNEPALRVACEKWLIEHKPKKVVASLEGEVEAAVAQLPSSAKEKLERAVKLAVSAELAKLRIEFNRQLEAEKEKLRAELEAEKQSYITAAQEAREERDSLFNVRSGIDSHMTMEEFQLVRNCLHPDRAPDDRKERFNRAFSIFNRLEKTVNTKTPIATLRDRGWEKASPRYKAA